MWDTADDQIVAVSENALEARLGERSDADRELRLERVEDVDQEAIADGEQRFAFGGGKLVRRPVAAGLLEEGQRAVVVDEELVEEPVGSPETCREETPQPFATHFAASAIEAVDRSLGVFMPRLLDRSFDFEPLPDHRDLPERHTSLDHAERARVHADENRLLGAVTVAFEVGSMWCARVAQRVVDAGDWRGERQPVDGAARAFGRIDQGAVGHSVYRAGGGDGEHLFSGEGSRLAVTSRGVLWRGVLGFA